MKNELSKVYNPKSIEEKWYTIWEEAKSFQPNLDDSSETFTVMIPPPNVTGVLHIGHVLNNSIQDILVRRARMQGKNTLWLPGTDHASIATEAKVTKSLKDKGINKKEIGREKFIEHCWDWTKEYGGVITSQLRKLGCSCDWTKERFTLDKEYYKSVIHTFVELYNQGLIYKGTRMVNWDCKALTALSDEEVIFKEKKSSLWYFKYPIDGTNQFLTVATTRPETMLGDTGVAVNPKDSRYKKFINKKIILPITGRKIPIFSDEYVDKDFGTGCVKVTPAHDPNDYAMGKNHNLEFINILNPNGTLNENAPSAYQGLDRFQARKKVVEELKNAGYLDKIEDYVHKIGFSERTDDIVEPLLSNQWFLKMDEIVKPALKEVRDENIKFYPDRWTKIYNHWLNNIQDWCISRQLWWGHRIPVWYKEDQIYCDTIPPDGDGWLQDEDVLDTWFSSWIWPMATLGWPDKKENLNKFYPTQDLVTGPDIIFFWVARMIISGIHFNGKKPFSNVYFTSIIRDGKGRKMSKSLGNSPDTLELFDKYGVDAVRTSILMMAPQGSDILFSEDRLEIGRNFMNKLWNCSRYILLNLEEENVNDDINQINFSDLDQTDIWILSRAHTTISEIDELYKNYKLNEVIKKLYNFIWRDYCDWYIEFSKNRFYGISDKKRNIAKRVAIYTLKTILKMLHPFAPFITEEIWSSLVLDKNNMLISSSWPNSDSQFINSKIEGNIEFLKDVISAIRNLKSELQISPKKKIDIHCRGSQLKTDIISLNSDHLQQMVNVENIFFGSNIDKPNQSATIVINKIEIFIPLKDLIDLDKELDRLKNKMNELTSRMNSIRKKLDNKNFISKAPESVVKHEQDKFDSHLENFNKLKHNYNNLSSTQI